MVATFGQTVVIRDAGNNHLADAGGYHCMHHHNVHMQETSTTK